METSQESSQSKDPRGEELHRLVTEGAKEKVEDFLRDGKGENNIVDYKLNGMSALHVAARRGNAEIAEVLMKVGNADIHARSDAEGDTPLHVAARHGHDEVVGKLLQHGAGSDLLKPVEDRHGDTPLHSAAQSGNPNIVKRMLSLVPAKHAGIVAAKNGQLRTPLHYAAGSGNPAVVTMLLNYAVKEGRQDVREACDELRMMPFHFAARSGDVKSLEMLVPGDLNVADLKGLTALHYAAWNARTENVEFLMDRGALIKSDNGQGYTPLHLAASTIKQGSDKVAEILVAKDPESWTVRSKKGELAIGLAGAHAIMAMLHSLRKHKPSTILDGNGLLERKHEPLGTTLLHYAAGYGAKEDMEWLLAALGKLGAKTDDVLDRSGCTPLHWAAKNGNIETLKVLAHNGADLTKECGPDSGERPLFVALQERHLDFAQQLLKCDKERSKINGARSLTTDEWMKGVEHWMKAYYNNKSIIEKHVMDALEHGFKRHTKKMPVVPWLPASNGGLMNVYEEIPPLYLALHAGRPDIAEFFQKWLSGDEEDAINQKGSLTGRTALHWAVLLRKRKIVEQLCISSPNMPDFSKRVRLCEEDVHGIAPIQYATEMKMLDIEAVLLKLGAVSKYIEGLYRDRDIYVDSTNAILVGAALIASVTFAGWLQPPMGLDGFSHVDIAKSTGLRVFWVFNSLSFFAAIGTVQAGACGVLPLRHVHIGRAVNYIRRALMVASLLMALSVVCVLGAFSAAGFIVLPKVLKYEAYMISTVGFGGLINAALILWFIERVLLAPLLLEVWRRHRLGDAGLFRQVSMPPDVDEDHPTAVPLRATPRLSMDKSKSPFPWDDGIEELYPDPKGH